METGVRDERKGSVGAAWPISILLVYGALGRSLEFRTGRGTLGDFAAACRKLLRYRPAAADEGAGGIGGAYGPVLAPSRVCRAELNWPNDLLLNGKKIGRGILD